MSYNEVMSLPIKSFWLMNDNITRVSAVSDMRQLSIMTSAQQGGEEVNAAMQRLSSEIGLVSMNKPVRDEKGFEQLKLM